MNNPYMTRRERIKMLEEMQRKNKNMMLLFKFVIALAVAVLIIAALAGCDLVRGSQPIVHGPLPQSAPVLSEYDILRLRIMERMAGVKQ